MQTTNHPVDYAQMIAQLAAQLPEDRAAQLYAFARFLVAEAAEETEAELAAEDAAWEAALTRHPDSFAALKTQALADIAAGNTSPMFDERGAFTIE